MFSTVWEVDLQLSYLWKFFRKNLTYASSFSCKLKKSFWSFGRRWNCLRRSYRFVIRTWFSICSTNYLWEKRMISIGYFCYFFRLFLEVVSQTAGIIDFSIRFMSFRPVVCVAVCFECILIVWDTRSLNRSPSSHREAQNRPLSFTKAAISDGCQLQRSAMTRIVSYFRENSYSWVSQALSINVCSFIFATLFSCE